MPEYEMKCSSSLKTQRLSHNGPLGIRNHWRIINKNLRAGLVCLNNHFVNRRRINNGYFSLKPLIATLYLTHRCNLKCQYCTERFPLRDSQELGTLEIFDILAKIRREMSMIYFTGGEVLLREDIVDIVRETSRLGFYPIYLGTNGLLLPSRDGVIDYVDRVVFSLDSMSASGWNRVLNSGPGKAEQVYEIISHYAAEQQKRNFSLIANCVITRDTVDQVYRVMDFCFENDIVFAPVSATVDSLPDPSLIALPSYQRLVQDILERKRRDCQILGTRESLEVLLMGKKYRCYAMISPHIYPNGDLFYPCQPLGRIAGNLLEFDSTTAIYHAGEKKFGKVGECRRGCALNCYVFTSFFIHHLWDQVAKESVIQFAVGSKQLLGSAGSDRV